MKTAAKLFKSLADETRLRILLLLAEHSELCVCNLMTALQLPQSTVSRHLAYLKHAGWLEDRRAGIWMHYSLSRALSTMQKEILASLQRSFDIQSCHAADQQRLEKNFQGKACL